MSTSLLLIAQGFLCGHNLNIGYVPAIVLIRRFCHFMALATDVSVFVACIHSLAHSQEEKFALVLRDLESFTFKRLVLHLTGEALRWQGTVQVLPLHEELFLQVLQVLSFLLLCLIFFIICHLSDHLLGEELFLLI